MANGNASGSAWIRTHWDMLQNYDEQWIAVARQELRTHDRDLPRVLDAIQASNIPQEEFTIHKVVLRPIL